MIRPFAPIVATVMASCALSGCVAAVVPAMAGGALLRQRMANAEERKDAQATPAASTGDAIRAPSTVDTAPATEEGGESIAAIIEGPLPPPSGAPTSIRPEAYADLYAFANKAGTTPPVGTVRHSAILADSGMLDATTAECSIHPAAVLIDLDPAGTLLDSGTDPHADPALADRLAALRSEDITIGWISGNTADRAGEIRRALVSTGLDPDGHDPLILLRYPDDRKQTRRADFAKEYCVVAIAGDERADFDELYKYLKDPSAALSLEPLLGKGWFLIPQPLT
ncbi:hypothetical protein [Tsuneonella flava]|uniref:hypothetical protein n=1 Tax=Tsuneonella flava TaxID=2055955 RepID=UPI000F4D1229|nr:hypothetical protein [Tsuneonella flava]